MCFKIPQKSTCIYKCTIPSIVYVCTWFCPLQKHEELTSNNGPVSIADVENETIVQLVDSGVAAIMTRLQSEWECVYGC